MLADSIIEHFGDLEDPRRDNRWHLLIDIVFITICAVICSAESWEDIEQFGQAKEGWLRKYLRLPHGIPSEDTFARVFAVLEPKEFNRCFLSWVKAVHNGAAQTINIDGKCLRGSRDVPNGKSAIHMVSAWAREAGLSLGQVKVDEKSNEITAIPELLDLLDLDGSLVTIDAMGTQTKIARKIIDKGGEYLLALKGNQGTLRDDVQLVFGEAQANEFAGLKTTYDKSVEKDHGRIEVRQCWATEELGWLSSGKEWKGLRSICMLRAQRTIGGETTTEDRLYISSLPADAARLAQAIRSHWGIENSLHWVLDVAFREDESRKRKGNAPENLAVVRHIALNLLKAEKSLKRSIAGKRLAAGWDNGYLETVLSKAL
jgi:predicted transposase YbfD/YdcC